MASSYKDLIVWQKAMTLAVQTCKAVRPFPKDEIFGMTSQIRRAAVSIPSNIAEGQGRITKGEFLQSLGHSRGSLLELETQLRISAELGYLKEPEYAVLADSCSEVSRLLNGLIRSMRSKPN